MIASAETAVIHGIEAIPVRVETVISRGMPVFTVVGLADTMVREAKERIRAAITGSGMEFPMGRITMNMAPADIRKRGSHLDLAMALGILAASRQILCDEMKDYSFIGELSLDGRISHVKGILPMILALKKSGIRKMIVPESGAREAALVEGTEIYAAGNLSDVADHFNMKRRLADIYEEAKAQNVIALSKRGDAHVNEPDFADVRGQEYAKRAAVIAASGGHGLLMMGSPSTGKTMIAERISGILPEMSGEEQMKATVIHSVAGKLAPDMPVVMRRPFRRPHHRISSAGLIGGGAYPRPGEITLASGGTLFLDEIGEFDARVVDDLREPLEKKSVTLVRQGETYVFPADFLLVAATNPCKCGFYGDDERACSCTDYQVRQYQSKLSGPVLDRIDMHLRLTKVRYDELSADPGMSSSDMRKLVQAARDRQRKRYGQDGKLNADLDARETELYISLDSECESLLKTAYKSLKLDPRTLQKTRKIARTIADVEGHEEITPENVAEALGYREQELRRAGR